MKNQTVFSASIWKLIEKFGTKGIQFVIQIILARILLPNDYGIVAILQVFITLSNVFIQNGFSTSLIQKKEATIEDFSTALFSSLGIAVVMYMILFFTSPLIAQFYELEDLTLYLRVQALVLFAGAFNSIQYAYISRLLNFKVYTIATIISSTVSGVAGIFLAMNEFGVWALILQQIIANFLVVGILFFTVKYKVKFVFSVKSLKELFGYGWKILVSSLINSLYDNVYNLIIGKVFTKDLLGLYSRGQQFPQLLTSNLNETVQSVTLPVLSKVQDDAASMKNKMRKALMLNFFIVFPSMIGLSAISYEFIYIVLGEKWLDAVPYMSLLCVFYSMFPIHTMNLQCVKALGRSDIFLKLEIVKKVLEALIIIFTIRHGLIVMICGQIVISILEIPINVYPSRKYIGYGLVEQIKDLAPTFFSTLIMYIAVKGVSFLPISIFIRIIVELFVGVVVFLFMSYLFKNDSIRYLLDLFNKRGNSSER